MLFYKSYIVYQIVYILVYSKLEVAITSRFVALHYLASEIS